MNEDHGLAYWVDHQMEIAFEELAFAEASDHEADVTTYDADVEESFPHRFTV